MSFGIDEYDSQMPKKEAPSHSNYIQRQVPPGPDHLPHATGPATGALPGKMPLPQPGGYPYDYGVQYLAQSSSNNSARSLSNYAATSDFPTPIAPGYVQPEFMGDMCRSSSFNPDFEHPASFASPIAPVMFDMSAQYAPMPTIDRIDNKDVLGAVPPFQEQKLKPRVRSEPSIPPRPQQSPKNKTRSAHNIIEQRYRNKINAKFDTLSNSVPTLRVVVRSKKKSKDNDFDSSGEDSDSAVFEEEGSGHPVDLEGLRPARKLNKGTILAKSIEYIKFLEIKNQRMKSENEQLLMKVRMLGLNPEDSYRR